MRCLAFREKKSLTIKLQPILCQIILVTKYMLCIPALYPDLYCELKLYFVQSVLQLASGKLFGSFLKVTLGIFREMISYEFSDVLLLWIDTHISHMDISFLHELIAGEFSDLFSVWLENHMSYRDISFLHELIADEF